MAQYFTHLHVHTEYSLLDGAISHEALIEFAKKHGIKAIGISDHGNVFGAVKFFQACAKAGIKPILGMEAYFTDDVKVKEIKNRYQHLIIIVVNDVGYKNLCKLISFSYREGFYFRPRIDYRALEKHNEGLIVTTACLNGAIPTLLMQGSDDAARERVDWFIERFGRERFFLEVQPAESEEQRVLNEKLYVLAAEKNVRCVVGCDAHYPALEDRQAHEVMLSIQTHAKMSDEDRFTFGECRAYLRSPQEVCELFADHLDAVWNTGAIADMCEFKFATGKLFFPTFPIPADHTPVTYFRNLCDEGLRRLKAEGRIDMDKEREYDARLALEMDLIITMGFVEYFLVVSDFIQWAYRQGIPVGPGRGSAAGSLVAWALQITNIDPLKYSLLFERFLNPERVSMPDIDIDFCIDGRDRVINYVRERYGHDKVCQIITFGTMMAKGVIKDVSRALGMPFEDSNMITGLIPDQLKITLKEALEQEPRLRELVEKNEHVRNVFDIAYKLEGLTRHASKHAAGIVICPEPADTILPLYVPPKTDELVAQYDMTELEALGFLKIDFLGLKNLTLIAKALALINKGRDIALDMDKLPLDDTRTFALLCAGTTTGVFQFESKGLKDVLTRLAPERFEDIVAVNALYRPGPLGSGMVDDFIERRNGRQEITYLFPELEPILKETYGVIVYQEQVMKIASTIAGYTLAQADILRRAMGKKKAEVMAEQRALFLEGARRTGFDGTKAGELFDLMAYFAGYGFNKSHSAAYSLITYQTAYLKAHFPAEFMACLISLEAANPESMAAYLGEARSMGITILPPDINRSGPEFTVDGGAILFGLQGVKSIGSIALDEIMRRRAHKPFADILDFALRVDMRAVNKRVMENLICAGAFDAMPGSRSQKYHELATIMERALTRKKEVQTGQASIFAQPSSTPEREAAPTTYQFQERAPWTDKEKLEREKEVMGLYVSNHPLAAYELHKKWLNVTPFACACEALAEPATLIVGYGLMVGRRDIVTKKGDPMAFVQLEDADTMRAELVVFPSVYKKIQRHLDDHQVFIFKGFVDSATGTQCKIRVESIIPLDMLFDEGHELRPRFVLIKLPESFGDELVKSLRALLESGNIPLRFSLVENAQQLTVDVRERVAISFDVLARLASLPVDIKVTL